MIDEVQKVIRVDKATPSKGGNETPKSAKKLNPTAPIFNPSSPGFGSAHVVNKEGIIHADKVKESTAQWAKRAFGGNNITTNQSCQEIPSQSLDTRAIEEQEKFHDRLNFNGGRLWSDQVEEHSDEEDDGFFYDKEENDQAAEDDHGEEK